MAQKNNLTIQVVSIIGGILTAIFLFGISGSCLDYPH